jgi:hypothetical protein
MNDDGTFKVSRKAFYDAMADSPMARGFASMADRLYSAAAKDAAVENAWADLMESTVRVLLVMGVQPSDCLIEHFQDNLGRPIRRVLKAYGQPVMEVLTERTSTGPYSWTVTHTPRFIAWPTLTAPQVRADSMSGET